MLCLTWLLVVLSAPPLPALITSLVSPAPCQWFNCHHLLYEHLHFLLPSEFLSWFPSCSERVLFYFRSSPAPLVLRCRRLFVTDSLCSKPPARLKPGPASDYWLRCWESPKLQRWILMPQITHLTTDEDMRWKFVFSNHVLPLALFPPDFLRNWSQCKYTM